MGETGNQNTEPKSSQGNVSNAVERAALCRKRADELLEEANLAPPGMVQLLQNTAAGWLALAKHIEGRAQLLEAINRLPW